MSCSYIIYSAVGRTDLMFNRKNTGHLKNDLAMNEAATTSDSLSIPTTATSTSLTSLSDSCQKTLSRKQVLLEKEDRRKLPVVKKLDRGHAKMMKSVAELVRKQEIATIVHNENERERRKELRGSIFALRNQLHTPTKRGSVKTVLEAAMKELKELEATESRNVETVESLKDRQKRLTFELESKLKEYEKHKQEKLTSPSLPEASFQLSSGAHPIQSITTAGMPGRVFPQIPSVLSTSPDMQTQLATSFFPTVNPYFPMLSMLPRYMSTPHLATAQQIPLVPGANLNFNMLSNPAAMAGVCNPFLVGCNKIEVPTSSTGALYSPFYPGLIPRPIALPSFLTNQGVSGNILSRLPRLDRVPDTTNPETIVNVCPSSSRAPFLGSKQPLSVPTTALVKSLTQSMKPWLSETDPESSRYDWSVSDCDNPNPHNDVSPSELPSIGLSSTKRTSGSVHNRSTSPFRFHNELDISKHPSTSLHDRKDQNELKSQKSGRSGVIMNGNLTCRSKTSHSLSSSTLANGVCSRTIQKNVKEDNYENYPQESMEQPERLSSSSQRLHKSVLDNTYSRSKKNNAPCGHVEKLPVLTNGAYYYPELQPPPPKKQRVRSIPPLIKIHEYQNAKSEDENKDEPLQVAYSNSHSVPNAFPGVNYLRYDTNLSYDDIPSVASNLIQSPRETNSNINTMLRPF